MMRPSLGMPTFVVPTLLRPLPLLLTKVELAFSRSLARALSVVRRESA
jgi:hypothetical protein